MSHVMSDIQSFKNGTFKQVLGDKKDFLSPAGRVNNKLDFIYTPRTGGIFLKKQIFLRQFELYKTLSASRFKITKIVLL